MPVTTKDILTDEDAVLAEVEEMVEQRMVFREAFRDSDLGNVTTDTAYYLVYNDNTDDIEVVPEGTEFPRNMSNRTRIPIHRDKYGEEYAITMEAVRDQVYNEVEEEAESKMRRFARTMDNIAWNVLSGNLNATTVGDNTGTLTYNEIVDANTTLLDDPYNFEPNALFVGPQGLGDLLKSEKLTQATDAGEERIREGLVGQIAGIGNVYLSTTGALGAGQAILVDTNAYGREGVWEDIQTETYDDQSKQIETVMQFWTMRGWAALQPNAALRITG